MGFPMLWSSRQFRELFQECPRTARVAPRVTFEAFHSERIFISNWAGSQAFEIGCNEADALVAKVLIDAKVVEHGQRAF